MVNIKNILSDIYEILYDSFSPVRAISSILTLLVGKVSPSFREKINERINIEMNMPLQYHESASIPYGSIILSVQNNNNTSLKVDALQINISHSKYDSVFQSFYWDRESISNPPKNYKLREIAGKENGNLEFSCMLPYYLYFPNRDMTIYVNGCIKFDTDAGHIEHEFDCRAEVLYEPIWNMSTVQEDLMRNFSPSELAIERERNADNK